jgi:hypothetical protein
MLKEALSVRCTVCDWSSAGRMAEVEPLAEAHARTGHAVLLRLPPAPTRRNVVGTKGADIGHYTAAGFVAVKNGDTPSLREPPATSHERHAATRWADHE